MKADDIMKALEGLSDSVIEECAEPRRIKKHNAVKIILPFAAVFFIIFLTAGIFIKNEQTVPLTSSPAEVLPPMGEGDFIPENDVDKSIFFYEKPDFTLPVYKNHFPAAMGGVQYQVTEEIKKEITDRFFYFSGLAGIKLEKHYWADEKNAVYAGYSDKGDNIIAGASHISVSFTGEMDAYMDKTEVIRLFNENACLSAMGKMAGIKNPQVYMHKTHTHEGKLNNEIYIYEKGADRAQEIINAALRSVRISLYEQQNFYSFTLSLNDLSETVNAEEIPFEQVLENTESYTGYVLYYDKSGEYFMPCCRFYKKVPGGYETVSAEAYRVTE